MDLSTFFFAAGVALFIALLAWGDSIRKPRDEIVELERNYINQLKKKKHQILPLLRPEKYTFTQQMSSLIELWDIKLTDKDIELRKIIKSLNDDRKFIEKCYSTKFFSTISLTLITFILGFLSIYYGNCIFFIGKIISSWNKVFITIFVLILLMILSNMIITNGKEKSFLNSINDALDKLGD